MRKINSDIDTLAVLSRVLLHKHVDHAIFHPGGDNSNRELTFEILLIAKTADNLPVTFLHTKS